MNANETAFAAVLEGWKQADKIRHYGFEEITFRLAPKTTYTPDFHTVEWDHSIVFYECKAGQATGKYYVQGDGGIKMKLFAERFQHFPLYVTWAHKTYDRKYKEIGAYGASNDASDEDDSTETEG